MRGTSLLAVGVTLAVAVAAPRAARCCGRSSGGRGALVLTVAAARVASADAFTRLRDLTSQPGVAPLSAGSPALEAVLAAPQLALGIARQSAHQLRVRPTYASIGRFQRPGFALSGRF